LAIFGAAHSFQRQALKEACIAQYPQIVSEQQSPETWGLLVFLRKHVLDLGFLDYPDETINPDEQSNPDETRLLDEESGPKDEAIPLTKKISSS